MTFDFKVLANSVAATAADQTQVSAAGPARELPPQGMANMRLVGYVETGKHSFTYEGKTKTQDEVQLVFELSGKNYPPREYEGETIPERVTVRIGLSLNEKAHFYKIFTRMNYEGKATHMSQLLGNAFRGRVVHQAAKSDPTKKYLSLKTAAGYEISPPRIEVVDEESGETSYKALTVAPALSSMRLFVWNAPVEHLKPMWDCIFIDGSYGKGDAARSANVFQAAIKSAENFKGSPIDNVLSAGGETPDIPDAVPGKGVAKAAKAEAAPGADPLDDVA